MGTGLDAMIDQGRKSKKEKSAKRAAKLKKVALGLFEKGYRHAQEIVKKEPLKAALIATTVVLAFEIFAFRRSK